MSPRTQERPSTFQLAEDRIQKIDPKTGRVLATIPAPGGGDSGSRGPKGRSGWGSIGAGRSIKSIPKQGRFFAPSSPTASSLKIYPDIERADADPSFDQLLAAPPLQPMPLVVLSADHPWGPLVPGFIADGSLPPDTPPDIGYVTDRAQKQAQAELAAAVPGSKSHHQHRQRARDPQGPAAARPRLDPRSRRSRARRQDKPGALTNSHQGRYFAF